MRHSYSKILGPIRLAVLDLIPTCGVDGMDPEGLIISRVNTPFDHRCKGHARELMRECLADADAEGVTLYLHINSYGHMTYEQLSAWYIRCGFEVRSRLGLYVREPVKGGCHAEE